MNMIFVIVGLSKNNLIIVDHSITLNHSLDIELGSAEKVFRWG
jgi:hypothetical protein